MTAFWADRDQDRYLDHVREHAGAFTSAFGDIAPVVFASAAWQVATMMDPPYVRWHRRVLSAYCMRNTWDGTLNAQVTIVGPRPAALTASQDWMQDRGWQDWPQILGQFVAPSPRDAARHPFLQSTLLAQVPVPLDDLPPAPEGPDDEFPLSALRAVTVVARELDAILGPMLALLDSETASGGTPGH